MLLLAHWALAALLFASVPAVVWMARNHEKYAERPATQGFLTRQEG